MRRFLTRPAALVLTFCLGLALVFLFGGLVGRSLKRLAERAGRRVAAPYVAEAGRRYMQRRILYDLRDYYEADSSPERIHLGYEEHDAQYKEKHEVERRVLPKLFPGGYLDQVGKCDRESGERREGSEADLVWARGRGQFVPYLSLEWPSGSFTAPGASEVLYHVRLGECTAREHGAPTHEMLAVFDHWDGLHAAFEVPAGNILQPVRDVDGDGVDEVLLMHGEMEGNKGVFSLRLVSLSGGRLRVVHDFGVGYVYSLGSDSGDGRVITIPVIYYTPRGEGQTPEFEVDFYRAECNKSEGCDGFPRPGAWRYLKSGRLDEADIEAGSKPWMWDGLTLPQH